MPGGGYGFLPLPVGEGWGEGIRPHSPFLRFGRLLKTAQQLIPALYR